MSRSGDMDKVWGGRTYVRPERHLTGSVFEGRIHSVDLAGAYFTSDMGEGRFKFGPCPYPISSVDVGAGPDAHDHANTPPTVGHRCLVQSYYDSAGTEKFWIIATWPA